ncbi:PAS domain-containing protein [Pseudogulbenkiania sp. NH8B]|uniref:PAS domain-containing protein n=1 Tax=Pseudogulbenkiania sp. (strain NH8B) TaxID=748280 RepID=UPI001E3D5B7F|nr:PAS domain-containing protein [Pseudogulbenkiania sp. NH8B]
MSTLSPPSISTFVPLPPRGMGLCALAMGLASLGLAWLGIWLLRGPGDVAAIWLVNGFAMAVLARAPATARLPLALAFLVGVGLANVLADNTPLLALGLGLANLAEVALGALLLRLIHHGEPFLSSLRLTALSLLAVGPCAAVVGASAGALVVALELGVPFGTIWPSWWFADGMGALVLVPLLLLSDRSRWRQLLAPTKWLRVLLLALLVALTCYAGVRYLPYPFIFAEIPLIAGAMLLGLFPATLLILLAAALIVAATLDAPEMVLAGLQRWGPAGFNLPLAVTVSLPVMVGALMDALERQQTALELSRKELSDTMQAAAIGMALVSTSGHWLKVNPALCQLLGYREEELLPLTFQDVTHPDDLELDLANVHALLEGRADTYRMEKRYLRQDGRELWAQLAVSIVRDRDGRPLYFVAQVEDIDQLKRAQEALRESEARWNFALSGSGQGVWDWDLASGTVFFSDTWKGMLGYAPGEIGQDIEEWWSRIHPQDEEWVRVVLQRIAQGRDSRYAIEYRLLDKRHNALWIHDRGVVIERDAAGQPRRLIGTHTDISARKRDEAERRRQSERMALAVAAARVGIWEWHIGSNTLIWDERMYELYGRQPGDGDPPLEYWYNSLHPDDSERALQEVVLAQQGKKPLDTEFRALWPDGQVRHIRALATVRCDEYGVPVAMTGTNWDITEQRRLADALAEEKELWRVTLHSIGDAVIATDTALVINYMNPVAERLTGWRQAEARGWPLSTVLVLRDQASGQPLADPVEACLRQGQPVFLQPGAVLIGRDGRAVPVLDSAAPVRAGNGSVIGAVLVLQDLRDLPPSRPGAMPASPPAR